MHIQLGDLLFSLPILQGSIGFTSLHITGRLSDHKGTALLLAAGANPTIGSDTTWPMVHKAAVYGNVA